MGEAWDVNTRLFAVTGWLLILCPLVNAQLFAFGFVGSLKEKKLLVVACMLEEWSFLSRKIMTARELLGRQSLAFRSASYSCSTFGMTRGSSENRIPLPVTAGCQSWLSNPVRKLFCISEDLANTSSGYLLQPSMAIDWSALRICKSTSQKSIVPEA